MMAAADEQPARLDDLLAGWRNRAADAPAFVEHDEGLFPVVRFDTLVRQTEAWLRQRGLVAGDCIAVWLLNRIEWLALLFAAARIGVRIASVNTRFRAFELEHILSASRASMLILQSPHGRFDPLSTLHTLETGSTPTLRSITLIGSSGPDAVHGIPVTLQPPDLLPDSPSGPDTASEPDAPLIYFTTSGTTSAPKLVMHVQRTLALHAQACATSFGFDRPGAALLAAMPLCGVFGLNPVLAAIAGGAPVHLMPAFDAEDAVELVERNRITHLFGSDEMFRRLGAIGRGRLHSARYCGFAAFTPGAGAAMKQCADDGLPMCGVYGSSEVNALFAGQPLECQVDERLKAGGRPSLGKGADVRVRDTESGELLDALQHGELEIRAPTNFIGYLDNQAETEKAVDADGYFRTGDIGYLRDDGSFVFVARRGDAIRLAGFLVDPVEIEDALRSINGIADAQVVGVDHDNRTRAVAFVTQAGNKPIDETAVLDAAQYLLADFKVPLRVFSIKGFPVTESANGIKIQKGKLREMAYERLQPRRRAPKIQPD